MKKPLHIHIPEQYGKAIQFKDVCPANAHHKISYAACNYWQHPKFAIIEQYYDAKDAFICLTEVNSKIDLEIPISCHLDDLYWVYQLRGECKVYLQEPPHTVVLESKAHFYTVVEVPSGNYIAHLKRGRHLLFYFVLKDDWLSRNEAEGLDPLMHYLQNMDLYIN